MRCAAGAHELKAATNICSAPNKFPSQVALFEFNSDGSTGGGGFQART